MKTNINLLIWSSRQEVTERNESKNATQNKTNRQGMTVTEAEKNRSHMVIKA